MELSKQERITQARAHHRTKEQRRAAALERAQVRLTRTAAQQIAIVIKRRGDSNKEYQRLVKLTSTTK